MGNKVPIINLIPAADAADQDEPEPPQEMAAPTALTADVFDEDKDEVEVIVEAIEVATLEAEGLLKVVTTCDLTASPTPAPPRGTGVPTVWSIATAWSAAKAGASTAGAYNVNLSPTEDAGPSDDETH